MCKIFFHSLLNLCKHHTMISVCPDPDVLAYRSFLECGLWAADLTHPQILAWRLLRKNKCAQSIQKPCRQRLYSQNSTWIVTSCHVSTRHDTFDVSSPYILALSSLSSSTARHIERIVLCRVKTWRDEPNWIVAYLACIDVKLHVTDKRTDGNNGHSVCLSCP